MVDIGNMIEGLNGTHHPEPESQALAQTAQAALEDQAEALLREGATPAHVTSVLVHLAIQAARNIAP